MDNSVVIAAIISASAMVIVGLLTTFMQSQHNASEERENALASAMSLTHEALEYVEALRSEVAQLQTENADLKRRLHDVETRVFADEHAEEQPQEDTTHETTSECSRQVSG